MAYVDWEIRGPKIAGCSCDYGCPCEFNGRPSRGYCRGVEAHLIEKGHFGEVPLDGLVVAAWYRWPGAVHEGGGEVQGIIDKRASPEQVEALFKILGGEEQEPTTMFNIYGSTMEKEFDPVFEEIQFACDMAARTGSFRVGDMLRLDIEPIRNPVTGKPHRARIVLPEGFEFSEAEMGSADLKVNVEGLADFGHDKCYGALFHAAYGPQGIIRGAA
ncbi:DUF1326 domain-containing protein [Defluviimonas sp. WL0024]|uniref:DUF1326 domain-containing protein n=2 Tax=Albidovulum TaxID=205889 RepID=A0ABT3J537_9RHOB|nr:MULTISPECIES: DUF1326 domain-containing protein [Defluviimonas]MCU9849082.1 DUF1326 domain-containing protein [Defluviimonas sp. WL0024]MCW3782791.1 DUF1326 domain-containing protein [Defluviimonas salinarum]